MARGSAKVHKDCVPTWDSLPLYVNNNTNNTSDTIWKLKYTNFITF